MKRFFFLAVAATMAFAACNKTEVVYPDGPQEISFTAVSKVATKAPVAGTTFSTVDDMYVAAYIAAGSETDGNFFEPTLFKNSGTYWTGQTPRYWPLTTSIINFLAVTNKGGGVNNTTVTFDAAKYASAATVTLADNSGSDQNDLMFAAGQGTHTQGGDYDPVSMVFKHALAWVNFNVAKNDVSSAITVNSIKLNGASYSGTLNLQNGQFNEESSQSTANVQATWTPGTPKNGVAVPRDPTTPPAGSGDADAVTLTTGYQSFGNGLLVVPGNQTSFTINYTVTTGVAPDPVVSNTFDYTYNIPSGTWDMAKKYTYNVTISLNEIKIAPEVGNWTPVTPETNVTL